MASSSIGSDFVALFALLVITLLVLLLLRHYLPLRSTPAYLLVPVFFALALPCSIILLVPIDLASSSGTDTDGSRGIWLPDKVILVAWRISYWLTFMLTWFILPLLGEYSDSGFREPRDRFLYSLRSNGRYQLIVLSVSILGGVYFFLNQGFKGQSPKGLVIALAYAWGLIMAIYLMGHGLIAIPRKLFRDASVSGRLKRVQAHAPVVHDKMDEALEELANIEVQVEQLHQRKAGLAPQLRDWIEELSETSVHDLSRRTSAAARTPGGGVPAVVTERYLSDLARKLKRARHKRVRFVDEWQQLVQQATDLQAILDAAGSKRLDFGTKSSVPLLPLVTPYTRYHLHTHILPAGRLVLGSVLTLASISLVWSEIVHTFEGGAKLSIIGLTVVHHPSSSRGEIGIGGQFIASLWLFYMCTAALFSLSEVKIWGNRALVKRQTYGESACWYSLQVAKLTVPLSYNFITMMQATIYKQTQFYGFLGKLVNLTPLGAGFSRYFPIFVLLPVCATLFNLYGKVKNVIGFGVLEDEGNNNSSGFGTGGWREGRALIERELHNSGDARVGLSATSANYSDDSGRPSLEDRGRRSEGRQPLLPVSQATSNAQRQTATTRDRIANEELDESGRYFFQDLGERVRNTFETSDGPQWLKDLPKGFKKPKWMSNDGSNSDDGGGNVFGRLFGRSESQVRL